VALGDCARDASQQGSDDQFFQIVDFDRDAAPSSIALIQSARNLVAEMRDDLKDVHTAVALATHVLLGSVVATVAIVGARAADLPAKTALPAEYEKICNVAGMTGFVLPGSDTCVKISGFATGQIEAGNIKTGYLWTTQGVALSSTPADQRPAFGYTAREFLTWDARQDTPYGTLRGLFLLKIENGNGFDNTGTAAYMNLGYVQWAGLTVGKAPSFFGSTEAVYPGRRFSHRTSRRQTSLICSLIRRHSAKDSQRQSRHKAQARTAPVEPART
jgi:hypothetical protein